MVINHHVAYQKGGNFQSGCQNMPSFAVRGVGREKYKSTFNRIVGFPFYRVSPLHLIFVFLIEPVAIKKGGMSHLLLTRTVQVRTRM
jgi:hypothetical protein